MRIWDRLKLGLIPLAVVAIPVYFAFHLWDLVKAWGLHIFRNDLLNVSLTILLVMSAAYLLGCLFETQKFQNFAKSHLGNLPVIGWLLLLLLLPKGVLKLVEVKTVWGPNPDEGVWEYGLLIRSWQEESFTWHKIHTLGFGGRLLPRAGDRNVIKIPNDQQK